MSRRRVLLIGNEEFEDIESFPKLRTPGNDAKDFASTLQDYGEFEIANLIINQDAISIKASIEDFYNETEKGDLVVLYYSGHGYIDKHGNYYLIAKDTSKNRLLTTGISEDFITSAMHTCRSFHRVLILDCCFSGVLAKDRKGEAESILLTKLHGDATAILTSSSSVQKSYEEMGKFSLFTKYLISGIVSGQADRDGDGYIAIDELFQYAEKEVRGIRPEQTPMILLQARESRILIAKNPKVSVSKRLTEIDATSLPTTGILTGDQRLTLIELCVKLLNQFLEFDNFLQGSINTKNKALSNSEGELQSRLIQSQYLATQAARYREPRYYSGRGYQDYSSYRTSPSFSGSFAPMLAMLAHAMESGSISHRFFQATKEEVRLIPPLIEPILHAATQTGLDKSDLWLPVEKSFNSLNLLISKFIAENDENEKDNDNDDNKELETLVREISVAESSLSKLIGGLEGWEIFDHEGHSEKWFRRKIKHAVELNGGDQLIKEKIQELITSLANSISDNMVNEIIKPTFFAWRAKNIRTLSETALQVENLSKQWQGSDKGKALLFSCVKEWHKTLSSKIDEIIRPVYDEFGIPITLLDSAIESFDMNVQALSSTNVNFDAGVQEIGKVIDVVLVVLGAGTGLTLLIPGIGELELLLGLIYAVAVILINIGGRKMISESMPDMIKRKIVNANLPGWLRNRINDQKLEKVFEEARTQAKDSISKALRENFNDDDIIRAVWQEIDVKIDSAVKYLESASKMSLQSENQSKAPDELKNETGKSHNRFDKLSQMGFLKIQRWLKQISRRSKKQ